MRRETKERPQLESKDWHVGQDKGSYGHLKIELNKNPTSSHDLLENEKHHTSTRQYCQREIEHRYLFGHHDATGTEESISARK